MENHSPVFMRTSAYDLVHMQQEAREPVQELVHDVRIHGGFLLRS